MEIGLMNWERWYDPNFSLTTKVPQITILDIYEWDRIKVNI